MAEKKGDRFANKFYGTVVESAANTLTFKEIQTNVDTFSKRAWVLHRLEWYIPAAQIDKLTASGDFLDCALVSSDKLAALSLASAGVIDLFTLAAAPVYTGVGFTTQQMPFIRDFSEMPGGGLIIAPRPLYLAVKGTSLASALTVELRGFFTNLELNADEYLELVDFYRIVQ